MTSSTTSFPAGTSAFAGHVAASEPYPWPFDGTAGVALEPDRLAVVACGMQRHWVDAVSAPDVSASIDCAGRLIDELRRRGTLVVMVRHGALSPPIRPIDRTLPDPGTRAWELIIDTVDGDLVIDTPAHDAFAVAWMDQTLRSRGIDRLAMVGVGTETTVSGTLRSANDRGFECITVLDAVTHHAADTGAATLSSICMSGGIFGAIGTSVDLLAAVATPAHPPLAPTASLNAFEEIS
jgi:nicotinamidase-related amidase